MRAPQVEFRMGLFTRSRRAPSRPTSTADALFTPVQQRVLGVLFCNPARSFSTTEVVSLAGTSPSSVERELGRLESAELVVVRRAQNERHYQANSQAPAFNELRTLVLKTSGVADVIRVALATKARKIRAAFVYGPVEKTQDDATSDVQLLIISDTLIYADLAAALGEASNILGRTITPMLHSSRELARRVRSKDPVTMRILAQPRIWLMGASAAEL
jgi:DNA-binding MarR family transcriptional regulator